MTSDRHTFLIVGAVTVLTSWIIFRSWSGGTNPFASEIISYLVAILAMILIGLILLAKRLRRVADQASTALTASLEALRKESMALEEETRLLRQDVRTGFDKEVRDLRDALRQSTHELVYTVDRETVYQKLEYFARRANNRVYLMYFGRRPPSAYIKSSSKDSYVSELDLAITEHLKNFRRIILYTPENKSWIETVIRSHAGNDRFSLSILQNSDELPLMSAQVIDDDLSILMNLDTSSSLNKPRDIIVESKNIVSIVEKYYEDMFSKAIPLMVNGIAHVGNVQRFLGSQALPNRPSS